MNDDENNDDESNVTFNWPMAFASVMPWICITIMVCAVASCMSSAVSK